MRKIKFEWGPDPRDKFTLDQWCRYYTITTLIGAALTAFMGVRILMSPPQSSDAPLMIGMGFLVLMMFGCRVWMGVLRDREREAKEKE